MSGGEGKTGDTKIAGGNGGSDGGVEQRAAIDEVAKRPNTTGALDSPSNAVVGNDGEGDRVSSTAVSGKRNSSGALITR